MTKITIAKNKKDIILTAKGHAGAGDPDRVCAAISMLCYTLAENVDEQYRAGEIRNYCFRDEPGDLELTAKGCGRKTVFLYRVIQRGFELLQMTYPNNVSVESDLK